MKDCFWEDNDNEKTCVFYTCNHFSIYYGFALLAGMGAIHPIVLVYIVLFWIAGIFLSKTMFWGGLLGFIPGACFTYMGTQETGQIYKEPPVGVIILLYYASYWNQMKNVKVGFEEAAMMKKFIMLTLALMLCVSLTGCEKKTTIDIPFDIADVNNVEMYHYAVPDSAEKKVITETDDITELYTMFSEIEVSNKKLNLLRGKMS